MTDLTPQIVKELAEKGTEGPWGLDGPFWGSFTGYYDDGKGVGRLALFNVTAGPSHARHNAQRIANVPALEQAYLEQVELLSNASKSHLDAAAKLSRAKDEIIRLRSERSHANDHADAAIEEATRQKARVAKLENLIENYRRSRFEVRGEDFADRASRMVRARLRLFEALQETDQ